jgi:hypothetical protein
MGITPLSYINNGKCGKLQMTPLQRAYLQVISHVFDIICKYIHFLYSCLQETCSFNYSLVSISYSVIVQGSKYGACIVVNFGPVLFLYLASLGHI